MSRSATDLTDSDILTPIWVGKKTGNIFKAVDVTVEEGTRMVSYRRPGLPKTYKIPVSSFDARFREATVDEIWNTLSSTAENAGADGENVDMGCFVEPDHRHELDRLILWPATRESIRVGLNRIIRRKELNDIWGLDQIEPRTNRCALNFYGPPGTGKTMAAVSIAHLLEKKLYQVDYSEIISKYVGDTAKHIKMAFRIAKENNAVLFWDEADSLLSKRCSMSDGAESFQTSINQNRNVLMQQIDAFDGVIIFATNFFQNYDEAILRRIARHVQFNLPSPEMRVQLYKHHLPVKGRVVLSEPEWEEVANTSKNFSGGDILNVCMNAINRASMDENTDDWKLSADDLLAEATIIAQAKADHSG